VTVTMLADAFFARSRIESRARADTPVAGWEGGGGAWAVSEVEPPMTSITAGQSQMAKGRRRGIMLCYEQYVHPRQRLVGRELQRRSLRESAQERTIGRWRRGRVGLQICD
jgi:uncharacterized protein YfaP (DUF2135 family)